MTVLKQRRKTRTKKRKRTAMLRKSCKSLGLFLLSTLVDDLLCHETSQPQVLPKNSQRLSIQQKDPNVLEVRPSTPSQPSIMDASHLPNLENLPYSQMRLPTAHTPSHPQRPRHLPSSPAASSQTPKTPLQCRRTPTCLPSVRTADRASTPCQAQSTSEASACPSRLSRRSLRCLASR